MNSKIVIACAALALSVLSDGKVPTGGANKLNLPSFRGVTEVKSAIKGRMRLRVPVLKGNAVLAEAVAGELEKAEPISKVDINTVTASILIEYDYTKADAGVIEGAVIKLCGLAGQVSEDGISTLERTVRGTVHCLNRAVYEKTAGFTDLKYTLSVILSATGIYKLIKSSFQLPGGSSLLWWGANIALRGR